MAIVSEARRAANRANAQKSTGPRSAAGRRAVRLNALKHGLAGETTVLPEENAAEFAAMLEELERRFAAEGELERAQVRAMAEAMWRLRRGPALEAVTLTALFEKEEAGELTADDVIGVPQLLLRVGRYEGRFDRAWDRAVDRLRLLQQARIATQGRPSAATGRAGDPAADDAPPRPTPRAARPAAVRPEPAPEDRKRGASAQRNSQFPADNGFVSSFSSAPEHWSLKARLLGSCAPAALLAGEPQPPWRFAPELPGAMLAPAREVLSRAA